MIFHLFSFALKNFTAANSFDGCIFFKLKVTTTVFTEQKINKLKLRRILGSPLNRCLCTGVVFIFLIKKID